MVSETLPTQVHQQIQHARLCRDWRAPEPFATEICRLTLDQGFCSDWFSYIKNPWDLKKEYHLPNDVWDLSCY